MTLKVTVVNRQRAVRVNTRALRQAALTALRVERVEEGEVSVAIVDDTEIRGLNRRYLHTDRPTDVLAFPQDGPAALLGDVVVSAERASVQAPEYGTSLQRELALLVIHGVLHLLGYDDASPRKARRMRRREAAILSVLGQAGGG